MSLDYKKTYLYHMTDIHNVVNIVREGALLSHAQIQNFTSIAHQSIQWKRSKRNVIYPPYGTLHDYVPFYFAPRSPMLFAIHKNNVATYRGNQNDIVYLVTTVNKVLEQEYKYIFTDAHGILPTTTQYNDINQLEKVIDWPLMKSKYWADTEIDLNRKERRQAEFLIYNRFLLKDMLGFAVKDMGLRERLKTTILAGTPFANMQVLVKDDWYF